jgi:C1A family cysteine protease
MAKHVYGFIKTPREVYAAVEERVDDAANLPASFDLTQSGDMPAVVDQGQLGSCTANAIAGAIGFDVAKQGGPLDFAASRLFIYYNERSLEGTVSTDSGATIADSVKAVNQWGCPPETDWPYDIDVFASKPPTEAYTDGKLIEAVKYNTVAQTTTAIKAALYAGFPVVIGFQVYESFESDEVEKTGVVPMPATNETLLGGHAGVIVGWDDATSRWKERNSWGTGWGQAGYCTFPYAYLTDSNLASDFWTVEQTTGAAPFPDPTPGPQPVPPPPSPSPAPDSALAAFIAAVPPDWENGMHEGNNKKVAEAVQALRVSQGLPK